MATITKKIWPEFFDAVDSGKKKFELRINDFEINEGDILELVEWDPQTKTYTGRKTEKKVSYVLRMSLDDFDKFNPIEEVEEKGIQIISLQ